MKRFRLYILQCYFNLIGHRSFHIFCFYDVVLNSKRPKKVTSIRKMYRMKWPELAWNYSAQKDLLPSKRPNSSQLK